MGHQGKKEKSDKSSNEKVDDTDHSMDNELKQLIEKHELQANALKKIIESFKKENRK